MTDYVAVAVDYARSAALKKNRRAHCKWDRLAAERFLDDLKRARRADCSFAFDDWHANDPCDFIEKLPHVQGSWDSATIVLEPAQIFWLVNVFGFRKRVDGTRRFSRVYIEVARKNAKSTLTAGVTLYCLTCEDEQAPIVVLGATTGDQARKVFEPAQLMVRRTQALREAFGLEAWSHRITCADNGGYIQTINAKSSTQDGWNPHVGVLDELHAHKDRGLHDVIRSAFGARKNPLMWMITTAGYNLYGVAMEQRGLVCKVLDGSIQADHIFGVIYTLDEGDNAYNERLWRKSNPLLGSSVSLDEMRGYALEAKLSPASDAEFRTKRLNLWLNSAVHWLSPESWKACGDPDLTIDDFDGLRCSIGVDLADRDDIAALVIEAEADGCVMWLPMFWIPSACIETRNKDIQAMYRQWIESGHLMVTDGDFIDHRVIKAAIKELSTRFEVSQVTFDQYGGSAIMASELIEDGINAVIATKSAKITTDPCRDLEARVKAGPARFRHPDNEVLNWMAANVTVSRRVDGSLIPKKEEPGSPNKIDGIDAGIFAGLPRMAVQENKVFSPYDDPNFSMAS